MITKKLKNQTFAWDQQAFNGKGYWFVLGKNGGLGLAASKAQAKRLGQPKDQVNEGDDKEVTPKVISDKTKKIIPKKKANIKNIAKSTSKRKSNKTSESEEDNKPTEVKSSGRKVGNLDTALYTAVAEDQSQRLMRGDGLATIAAKLVNFYKKTQEEKKLQRELKRNFEEELRDEEKRRVEKEQKDSTKPKKEKPKLEKMSKIGKLEHPETAARLAGEVEEKGFFGELGAGLRKAATTVVEAVVAMATPEVIATVVGTTALVGATIYASDAIAQSESQGNPNVTFGDRVDKQGKIHHTYLSPEESKFKKPLTQMTLAEVEEFQRIRESRSPNTGAVGKYGFMHSTLFGNKRGVGLVQQLGLDMNTVFSEDVQEKLNALMQNQNIQQLKNKGVPITPGYQYMATYIGAKGASEVHESTLKGEDKTVAQIMMEHGHKVGEKNKELYKIKAKDFEKVLNDRLIKRGHLTTSTVMPPPTPTGDNLNNKSAVVVADKKNKTGNANILVDKTTNVINNQSKNTKEIIIEEKHDDTPLILQAR